jgi:O-antigen/teichoic acid export membrane protein
MGIIQQQSIRSTIYIFTGFIIGAINILVLFPAFFSQTEIGMTRALMDISLTLSTLATFGSLPVIYKFYPFYKDYLDKNKNDLPFITGLVCLVGFIAVLITGYIFQDFLIRKLGKSPEFANYFYLIYPYSFLLMLFLWLEAFAWGLKKTSLTNFLRETLLRIVVTLLIILFAAGLLNLNSFMQLYSLLYLLPVVTLLSILSRSGQWKINIIQPSKVSTRLGKRMISFGMFIFGAQFLNVFARTSDTIFAIGFQGLSQAGLFAIGNYLVAIMEIPQRSLNAISIPVLAEAWKNRDMKNIESIYKKSVSNLLVIGTGLFCLIALNVTDLAGMLNFFGRKTNADYSVIIQIFFIMGIARIIDLGTGINSQIIGTSNFWRFDFFTNVFYTFLSIPLNYFLIKEFGIIGLAYANLIALTLYNLVRFIFLKKKFGLQPFSFKSLQTLFIAASCFAIIWFIPMSANWYIAIPLRSVFFCIAFVPLIYYLKTAPELSLLAEKFWKRLTGKNFS